MEASKQGSLLHLLLLFISLSLSPFSDISGSKIRFGHKQKEILTFQLSVETRRGGMDGLFLAGRGAPGLRAIQPLGVFIDNGTHRIGQEG